MRTPRIRRNPILAPTAIPIVRPVELVDELGEDSVAAVGVKVGGEVADAVGVPAIVVEDDKLVLAISFLGGPAILVELRTLYAKLY
jgi:hypothetical protein